VLDGGGMQVRANEMAISKILYEELDLFGVLEVSHAVASVRMVA
jgi:hypothetical protein